MNRHLNLLGIAWQPKAVFLLRSCPAIYVALSLIILAPLGAQQPGSQLTPALTGSNGLSGPFKGFGSLHPSLPGCPYELPGSRGSNSFRERACFYAEQLVEPGAAAHALFAMGISEWRNSPQMRHPDADDMLKRFSTFYERKAARSAGEFLAGSLHHEDFRPHPSGKNRFLARSRAALLGVVTTPGDSGGLRPAFAPIAGAFSSGFVGAAVFPERDLLGQGLRHSGAVYGCYFGSALFREFKPELLTFSNKLLRRTN